MKHFRIILWVPFSLAAAQEEKVTYDDHVLPVFQQACLNCHNPDKAKGGLDLSSFTATLKGGSGGKIVEPGNTGSTLISLVRHAAEPVMPPEGDKLSNDQISVLSRWIEGGLLENSRSTARKPEKPKFALSPHADPVAKPDGPPPMPEHLLLDPPVVTERAAAIQSLAASPWAPLLAVTSQNQILLHHTETLELLGVLAFPEGDPVSLAFTPDARYLIVGGGVPGKSGLTITFDVRTGERLLAAGREFDSILAADIRPGFDLVATGGPSRMLKIWDTATGEAVKSIKKHSDWITALDISPDGVLLASGDRNGGVWVWESGTGNEFHTLRAHQAGITAAVFRTDSNILATSSEDGTLRFWEMNGGSEIKKIDAHPGGVTAFSFARDGSSLSAGRDLSAKLWKPDFNHARDLVKNLPALPTATALDAEGKRAFVADAAGTVHVFATADGKALGTLPGNPPSIETRLKTITSSVAKHEQDLATAGENHATRVANRDKLKTELQAAEKAHQQAIRIHKAASIGAAEQPTDASKKIASEAQARIEPAAKTVEEKRAALAAAEKSLADGLAAQDAAKTRLASSRQSLKRWKAAAINARAINAAKLARSAIGDNEESCTAFANAALKATRQAESLNRKRAERQRFAQLAYPTPDGPLPSPSPETLAEINATLNAIDICIERELQSLRACEAELAQIRTSIDPAALLAHQRKAEAQALLHAYHEALK